jgi:hypothetical protein
MINNHLDDFFLKNMFSKEFTSELIILGLWLLLLFNPVNPLITDEGLVDEFRSLLLTFIGDWFCISWFLLN